MLRNKKLGDALRPFAFHGVALEWREGDAQAVGDCPRCGREGKFSVKVETGEFHCFPCDLKGGPVTFLAWLADASDAATTDYDELALDRGLLMPETLMYWGAAVSVTTRDWIIPAYAADGKLTNVYRYVDDAIDQRMKLMPTPTRRHGLFGVKLYDKSKQSVYLCEGPWDGMALWEMLGRVKRTSEGYAGTSSQQASMLADANVLAVPGNMTFDERWTPLFAGKDVYLMYDSDHPKKDPAGKTIPPAGHAGMRRAMKILSDADDPPRSIHYLHWGKDGYDASRPSGHDVRDHLRG